MCVVYEYVCAYVCTCVCSLRLMCLFVTERKASGNHLCSIGVNFQETVTNAHIRRAQGSGSRLKEDVRFAWTGCSFLPCLRACEHN